MSTALEKSKSGPRELFSVSQIEKAFGPGYEQGQGCIRSWGERYLEGWREPELTYEQAVALPERTPDEKKVRSSYIAKTFGKALEAQADRYLQGLPVDYDSEPGKRLFPGLHLLPHPSQIARLELQGRVTVRTGDTDTITWQGFKDLRFTLHTAPERWYLFDYKTTKPKVDNRKNAQLGKPAGSWTWMKLPAQLRQDWQWNLYQWDEYVTQGVLAPSRWVYWASIDKPEARASDIFDPAAPYDNNDGIECVRNVVLDLDSKARVLRDYIRQYKAGQLRTDQLPKNGSNCDAFGRKCPYHVSQGGTCEGETGVVQVGSLISTPGFVPVAFVTTHRKEGAIEHMSIMGDIQSRMAAAPPAPAPGFPGTGAPGYPAGAGAHLGAPVPNGGYPVPAAPPGPPMGGFQPQPGQPGFNPAAAPAPAPAPYVPPAPVAPAPTPAPAGYGTASSNPEYFSDGAGGWLKYIDLPAMAAAGDTRAGQFLQYLHSQQPSHVSPPEANAPPANQAPAPVPNAVPVPAPAADGPKKRGPKPKVPQAPSVTGAPTPTPAAPVTSGVLRVRATVTLENGCEVSSPITGELADAIAAYTLETALSGE